MASRKSLALIAMLLAAVFVLSIGRLWSGAAIVSAFRADSVHLTPTTLVVRKSSRANQHLTPIAPTTLPTATAATPPSAPVRVLLVRGNGFSVSNGAWIPLANAQLRAVLPALPLTTTLRLEAEVVPERTAFLGTPNILGGTTYIAAGASARLSLALTGLADGERFHWRVRLRAANGLVSTWSSGGYFGVSVSLPQPPRLAGTNVVLGGWSRSTRAQFIWTAASKSRVPIVGYDYVIRRPAKQTTALDQIPWRRTADSALELPHWPDGHWQLLVRAINAAGLRSGPAVWSFALARQAPQPQIVAAVPAQDAWSNDSSPTLRWATVTTLAPILGYDYMVTPVITTTRVLAAWIPTRRSVVTLPALTDGLWRVRVRAVDAAGNRSPALVWSFHIARRAAKLTTPVLSAATFTPKVERLGLSFGLDSQATVSYSIHAVGGVKLLRRGNLGMLTPGPAHRFTWDGHLASGRLAPVGSYTVALQAVDRAGNIATTTSTPVLVQDKWIRISLKQEALQAHQGTKVIYTTPVTTGGPDTRTPTGLFHVLGRYTGVVFHSPWPPGSPLWYPDSLSNFALLYEPTGGYFIHDAPWRWHYGPGSNSVAGTPGGAYTGSHGCTNVPYAVMTQLFTWADVGTPIQIVP